MTRLSGQVPSWIKMVAPSGSLEVTWGTNLFGNNSIFIFFNMVTVATFIIFRLSWGKRYWPLCHHLFHYYHNCLSHSQYLISCSGWVEGRGTILFVIIISILIMMTYNLFQNIPIIISQHRKLVPADQSQFTSQNSVILISTSSQVILISTSWQHSAQTNQEILLTNHISELCHPHSSTSWLQSANTDPFSRKWDPLRLVLIVICNLCNFAILQSLLGRMWSQANVCAHKAQKIFTNCWSTVLLLCWNKVFLFLCWNKVVLFSLLKHEHEMFEF